MYSAGPYLPVTDELGSVLSRQKTKWMWEAKKAKDKKEIEEEKLWQEGLIIRHPVRVSLGLDEVNLKRRKQKKIGIE